MEGACARERHSMFELTVQTHFAAAHELPGYPGPCQRLHGHNFRVLLTVGGEELDELGMLMDFRELKRLLAGVIARLDHRNLNELAELEDLPTSENLARHIYRQVRSGLDRDARV